MSDGSGEDRKRQLFMRQPDLGGLPEAPPLPPGYLLRPAAAADQAELVSLLSEGFAETWDAQRIAAEFSPANGVEATYVVTAPPTTGPSITGPARVVATAAARLLPGRYPGAGYVHYVAARRSERGKRLGELVTLRVLGHFAAGGLRQAVLETDDFRLPAIWTYLRLGFVPEPRGEGDAVRWSRVLRNLTARPARTATGVRS